MQFKPVSPGLAVVIVLLALAMPAWSDEPTTRPAGVLDFTVQDIDGKPYDLARHRGQVVLIVNTASKCGFTKQFAGLEALYNQHRADGLVVIGFPSNDFKNQDPGTNEDIKEFCTQKYGVTFPMMTKVHVKREEVSPVYQFLTAPETAGTFAGPIKWNFNKFLIGRDGRIVARFDSNVAPDSEQLLTAVWAALEAKTPGDAPANR